MKAICCYVFLSHFLPVGNDTHNDRPRWSTRFIIRSVTQHASDVLKTHVAILTMVAKVELGFCRQNSLQTQHPPLWDAKPTSIACLRKNILVSTTEIILELHSSKENDYHFPALSASWCRSTERNCSIGTMLHMTHCKDQATENLG